MKTTRIFDSAWHLTRAIEAAEVEKNDDLVAELLRIKQVEAWRRRNRSIIELSEM